MEEFRVFLANFIGICIEDIVGKQNISYFIITDIFAHILGEISIIDYLEEHFRNYPSESGRGDDC